MVCDVIDKLRHISSHMTSHTINYDVICRYLWCHMPLLHTYDIIGHCMWCHRSCNLFVIYDVIAIFVINLLKICANGQIISRDMPMTSHTMTCDVIAHGMWCHSHFCNSLDSYMCEILPASQQHAYDVTYHDLWHHSMYDMTSYMTSHTNIWQWHIYSRWLSPHDVSSWFQRLSVCSCSFSFVESCLSLPLILAVAMIFRSSTTIHSAHTVCFLFHCLVLPVNLQWLLPNLISWICME